MINKLSVIFIFVAIFSFHAKSQDVLPEIVLKSLSGENVQVNEIGKDSVVIVSFWATWCVPCIKELNAINDVYFDWQEETNVKLIAISVDDSRTNSRVKPLVNGKGWEYQILLDPNQELKRAMNIASVPYTIIVKNGIIVYKHTGYTSGGEYELYEKILELQNK